MALSVLDLFSIGIGPSSSHTVGPMRAARRFSGELRTDGLLQSVARVKSELFGSLSATGIGHGSDTAVIIGLSGKDPETLDVESAPGIVAAAVDGGMLSLDGDAPVPFDRPKDLLLHRRKSLPKHPNGMRITAFDASGAELLTRDYYSIGGGFVVTDEEYGVAPAADANPEPLPFADGKQLLERCREIEGSIAEVMLRNELAQHDEQYLRSQILQIWDVMQQCVRNGLNRTEALLPGGLNVRRRAPQLHQRLLAESGQARQTDPLRGVEWVNLYALAVNEENASGGRIVTAPTNGAAGIIPAVLHYFAQFSTRFDDEAVIEFFLTAGALGSLFKRNASISGAEVGCQGEVGSACSMAAGALCAVLGGTPAQVENAAEIGLEHNLGLTCDPVGGLVQIPCIERNAIAAMKAINAARLALASDGEHKVTLDQAITTMRETGADMKTKYKETSRGGLAVNVVNC